MAKHVHARTFVGGGASAAAPGEAGEAVVRLSLVPRLKGGRRGVAHPCSIVA